MSHTTQEGSQHTMEQQLRKDLGLPQAMVTVVGIIIGSGIFALPAVVFADAG